MLRAVPSRARVPEAGAKSIAGEVQERRRLPFAASTKRGFAVVTVGDPVNPTVSLTRLYCTGSGSIPRELSACKTCYASRCEPTRERAVVSELPQLFRTTRGEVECALSGAGPAVLALHGAMGGFDQSLLLARAAVPAGFRVVAPSRPGYLGTPLPAGATPEAQADLYAALLDALHIERAAVVVISGGGPSALRFALRHRARCAALVLISTIGGPMRTRLPASFHLKMWLGRRAWFAAQLERRIARDPDAAVRRAIFDAEQRARTLADPEAGPLLRELVAGAARRVAARIDGTRQDVRFGRASPPRLEDVRVPTLVVHGTEDPVVPFEQHGAFLARRIPGAELLAIENGRHVAIFTHLALVRARVARFLRGHT